MGLAPDEALVIGYLGPLRDVCGNVRGNVVALGVILTVLDHAVDVRVTK